jgi:hypothetical protein
MSLDKHLNKFSKKTPGEQKPSVPITNPGTNGKPKKQADCTVYYDAPKRTFWARNDRGEWTEYPTTHIRLVLLSDGVSNQLKEGDVMSDFEMMLMQIRSCHDVRWAGQLAGFQPGVYDVCKKRILVTTGPTLIQPKKGDWPLLREFMGQLLGINVEVLWGWLKCGLRSMKAGPPFRPGQALAIAGPAGCGKSLMQGLITEIFGGRSAKPYRYLSGETTFNGELVSAEHLAIEDEAASTDLRTRRYFGSQLKNLIANEVVSFHQKGCEAMSVTPFWRVSITLNDEAENLMVLPPLDESLKDKIILLRAWHATMPFDNDDLKGRSEFRAKLSAELPGFLHWLSIWKIPTKMQDKRFGIRAFQDPELLGELENLQPEFRLLELIDTLAIWEPGNSVWRGTATELRRELEDKDKRGEVSRLLSYNTACGVYLGRIAKQMPKRVNKKKDAENRYIWEIHRQ